MIASYDGDVTKTVVGRVVGPDTAGALYEAVSAEYVGMTNTTRVKFKPVLPGDQREVIPDEAGDLRIVNVPRV